MAFGAVVLVAISIPARAESAQEPQISARQASQSLYKASSGAAEWGKRAAGMLVFPQIVRAGLGVGAHYGDGALFKGDAVSGYDTQPQLRSDFSSVLRPSA